MQTGMHKVCMQVHMHTVSLRLQSLHCTHYAYISVSFAHVRNIVCRSNL